MSAQIDFNEAKQRLKVLALLNVVTTPEIGLEIFALAIAVFTLKPWLRQRHQDWRSALQPTTKARQPRTMNTARYAC